jgi:signal transduction histidine kinase/HAMP domain-containing protein
MRNLPLRGQLMLVIALLLIATTVATTTALVTLDGERMHRDLRVRAALYASQLQQQLQSVLEPDTRLTALQLLDSLDGDRDVDGLAIYLNDGELIVGRGNRPTRLSASAASAIDSQHVVVIDAIQRRGQPAARLYVSLSTLPIDAIHRRDIWIAAGLAVSILLIAFVAALQVSRRITGRLMKLDAAANQIARGDAAQVAPEDETNDEIGRLARSFNIMVGELNRFAIERERLQSTERERLERLVAERTQEIEQGREMFKLIAESTGATPFMLDRDRDLFQNTGSRVREIESNPLSRWAQEGALEAVIPRGTNGELRRRLDECAPGRFEFEGRLCGPHDTSLMLLRIVGTCEATAQGRHLLGLVQDVTALRRDERERGAAQKLESVGRLAAGIAHEINTPLQYVTDNMRFLQSSLADLGGVLVNYRSLESAVETGAAVATVAAAAAAARSAAESIDLDFLMENTTPAVSEALSGLDRITAIVRSMKEFAHPDSAQKTIADLNQAIKNTLVIAHSEYKYVADVEEQFGAIPQVRCHLGQINQVILNLIINATHAMAEAADGRDRRGTLTVRTRQVADQVEIAIGDNGGGIPEAVRDKLFDPFFTTKAVGVGTGQGLAIARDIVVNKHGGTLSFESQLGQGTTFFVRLPVNPPAETAAAGERAA